MKRTRKSNNPVNDLEILCKDTNHKCKQLNKDKGEIPCCPTTQHLVPEVLIISLNGETLKFDLGRVLENIQSLDDRLQFNN